MELSIIFVNWNSVDYLRDCIASIYENTNEISFEVIIVDNASPQEGVETLKSQFPDVLLIKSAKNVGFAGGQQSRIPAIYRRVCPVLESRHKTGWTDH